MKDLVESEDIYKYEYLDSNEANYREMVLKDYLDNKVINELEFVDLDYYLDSKKPKNLIYNKCAQSKFDPSIILLNSQLELLSILEEHNLFLSAPTSFGKTFIVLEYIVRHHEINNIVFIVPTLALMNELLKKIYSKLGDNYNICINGNEDNKDKNIFIFVPERSDKDFLKKIQQIGLDLLIIDEIYKLKPKDKKELINDDRIILMNKVYLNLIEKAKKVVLLGPFIKDILFEQTKLDIVKYYTNLNPVFNYVHRCVDENWLNYLSDEKELVFFKSPESIYKKIQPLLETKSESLQYITKFKNEIEYLEKKVNASWYVVSLLKRGIGIHHGKTPMYLRKFFEEEYKNGELNTLICTSTLMEGINTPTLRLLVVDDPGSVFALNNLIGRVGRLNPHDPKAGNIFLFNNESWKNYSDRNKWESLKILAEDKCAMTDDELLFLNKIPQNLLSKEKYSKKLEQILTESSKSVEELKEYDIKVNIAFRFVNENFKNKFLQVKNSYDCVVLTCELLGKIGYDFSKKQFIDIAYPFDTLPYKVFINNLLCGNDINEIIFNFQKQYGMLSQYNLNVLIDKLLKLKANIKFKFSKITNYFELFNVDTTKNRSLNNFYKDVCLFEEKNKLTKIFEDIGIEEIDYQILFNLFNQNDFISTSAVISRIKANRMEIEHLFHSPFTRKNILSL